MMLGSPHNSVRACHSCASFGIYQHRSSTARFGRRCESPGPVYLPRPPRRTAGVNMGCRGRAPQAAVHAARACWVPGANGSHEVLLVRSSRPHTCQHDAESSSAAQPRTCGWHGHDICQLWFGRCAACMAGPTGSAMAEHAQTARSEMPSYLQPTVTHRATRMLGLA